MTRTSRHLISLRFGTLQRTVQWPFSQRNIIARDLRGCAPNDLSPCHMPSAATCYLFVTAFSSLDEEGRKERFVFPPLSPRLVARGRVSDLIRGGRIIRVRCSPSAASSLLAAAAAARTSSSCRRHRRRRHRGRRPSVTATRSKRRSTNNVVLKFPSLRDNLCIDHANTARFPIIARRAGSRQLYRKGREEEREGRVQLDKSSRELLMAQLILELGRLRRPLARANSFYSLRLS